MIANNMLLTIQGYEQSKTCQNQETGFLVLDVSEEMNNHFVL
jgi:hypothetical protein